jgi:hypothetical protein
MAKNWTQERLIIERHGRGITTDEQFAAEVKKHQTQRRIGRKPHPHICSCQQTILTAWDAPQAALLTHLDPWALTKTGELWAIDHGLRTYHLNPNGIHRRDRWNRAKAPAPNYVVLAQHKCGQLIPEQHRMNRPKPKRNTPPTIDDPQF